MTDLMQSSKVTAARELIAEDTGMQYYEFHLLPRFLAKNVSHLKLLLKYQKPVLSDPEKIPATARPGKPEHNHVYFMKALSSGLRKGPPKKGKKI